MEENEMDLKNFVKREVIRTNRVGLFFRIIGLFLMIFAVIPLVCFWEHDWETISGPDIYSLIPLLPPVLIFMTLWLSGRAMVAIGAAYGLRCGQWTDIQACLMAGGDKEFDSESLLSALILTRRDIAAEVFVKALPDSILDNAKHLFKK